MTNFTDELLSKCKKILSTQKVRIEWDENANNVGLSIRGTKGEYIFKILEVKTHNLDGRAPRVENWKKLCLGLSCYRVAGPDADELYDMAYKLFKKQQEETKKAEQEAKEAELKKAKTEREKQEQKALDFLDSFLSNER